MSTHKNKSGNARTEYVNLPEIKKLSSQTVEITQRIINDLVEYRMPIRKLSRSRILHEGGNSSITRSDGSEEQTEMHAHSSVHETNIREHVHFDLAVFRDHLNKIADDFAEGMSKSFYQKIEVTTAQTGQVIDGKDRDLENAVLDALEMLPASENEDEHPIMVVSPEIASKIEAIQRLPQNPEIQKRLDKINEQKRIERNARKASRKLVG